MRDESRARIQQIDRRADGGVNVWFRVWFGDYVVNVPLTLEDAAGLDDEAARRLAQARFQVLAASLAQSTAGWGA